MSEKSGGPFRAERSQATLSLSFTHGFHPLTCRALADDNAVGATPSSPRGRGSASSQVNFHGSYNLRHPVPREDIFIQLDAQPRPLGNRHAAVLKGRQVANQLAHQRRPA